VNRGSRSLLWGLVVATAAFATAAGTIAPRVSLVMTLGLATAFGLVRRFGTQRGVFYLFLGTLPIREVLGIDVVGTKTLYPTDFLLYGLAAAVVRQYGLRSVWHRSAVLKIGTAVLALSVLALYGSPRPVWELAAIQRTVGQIGTLYVARCLVRSGAEAKRMLLAYVVGMVPAIVYGFYQSTIPVDVGTFPSWSEAPIAYEASGRARIRIFSTFDHSLSFSQALALATGISFGLLAATEGPLRRGALAAVAGAAAVCNQYTYSVSGLLGTAAGAFVGLLAGRSRRWLFVFPAAFVAWVVLTPDALRVRVMDLVSGQSNTALARIVTYRAGMRAFLDHPIRGVGWGGIGDLNKGEYQIARARMVPVGPENYFMFRMVALGIPGLLLFGALPFLLIRGCRRPRGVHLGVAARAWPRAAVLGGAAGYWIHGMFHPSSNYPNDCVHWLLLGLAESTREAALEPEPDDPSPDPSSCS
jgi:hypothetical protein